jgi:hypothetical protein
MRRISLAVVAVALSLGAAACGSKAASKPPAPAATQPTAAGASCANGDALYDVLMANAKMWDDLGKTTGLNNPVCVGGFALAKAYDSTTGGDPAVVLFQFESGKWKVLNGGTSNVCDGKVPAEVAKAFAGKGC